MILQLIAQQTNLHLLQGPSVQVNGLDLGDVGAHSPVDPRAPDAQKHTT
jgi:hypothetical protein